MNKLDTLNQLKELLLKARQKLSDEHDPNEDEGEDELKDLNEFDPDNSEDGAESWLKENDPEYKQDEEAPAATPQDEDEAHIAEAAPTSAKQPTPQKEEGQTSRFRQPTKEEIQQLRTYTRPWEQRAREVQKLRADPVKNPELAHQGNIIEARNKHHNDRKAAYKALASSPKYQNADPVEQMDMDDNFEKEWKAKNPDHMATAMKAHDEAHKAGLKGQDAAAENKQAQIKHIIDGGASPGTGMSSEEALQHIGGAKGDEGTEGNISQDPAATFAMGNQDFMKQFAKDYDKKKKVANFDETGNYDEGSKRDITRILGPNAAQDPKFNQFFEHHYPLIQMSGKRAMNQMGLDPKHLGDVGPSVMDEAGLHGLIQSVNDYDHDHPSKASFATHAGKKIVGLQKQALKNMDQIPTEVRQAQKKFMAARVPGAPKGNDLTDKIKESGHPMAADIADRLKRTNTARAAHAVRRTGTEAKPKPISQPISIPTPETEGEENE